MDKKITDTHVDDSKHPHKNCHSERDNLYFGNFMRYIGDLQTENNPIFNDILVVCGVGSSKIDYRISSILLAAISPVFKVIAIYTFNILCLLI